MSLLDNPGPTVNQYPVDQQVRALGEFQWANWLDRARPEQHMPDSDWRVWYLMGGRGSGKTRTGAETLARWEHLHPGLYAAVAPTFADARDVCAEDPGSGLLAVLGNRVAPGGWNRSLGEIHLRSGSRIFLDGADDGALRIQGKNLSGAWCIADYESIMTSDGEKPIKEVTSGDYVWTRNGWKEVTWAGPTQLDASTLTITLADGRSLTCTYEHQVWTERGWQAAAQLLAGDVLTCLRPTNLSLDRQPGTTGMARATTAFRAATTRAARRAVTAVCTLWSGNGRTTDRSPVGSSSITSTRIGETTARRIWSSCRRATTTDTTSGELSGTPLPANVSLLEPRNPGRGGSSELAYVRSVDPRSQRAVEERLAGVPKPVVQDGVVVSVEKGPTVDVYDLTVEDAHEFFAAGILVHNCDEIGLWASQWERAWKESIRFAVRHGEAKIVATGTPKMGHPLVALLVNDPRVPVARMKTSDNKANLSPAALEAFYEEYGSTRLGQQELDGEWIMALEGDLLKRAWWRYYPPRKQRETDDTFVARLPKFQMVLVSADTPLKDKESSDFVAIQVWGVDGANRYLLDARTDKIGYDAARRAVVEMSRWARRLWPGTQHRTLIENAGFGAELIVDLKRDLGLIEKVSPGAEGNKGQRAFSAASDLETGHCFLPGHMKDDQSGPDESSPAITHSLVEEAALFQMDGSHSSHDDQVDAWSQAMNWLRSRQSRRARTWSSFKQA